MSETLSRYIELRIHRDLSIREAAGEIGVSFSSLARAERGAGSLSKDTERRMRRWLGDDVPFEMSEMDFVPVPVSVEHAKSMIAVATAYLSNPTPE